MKSFYLLKKDLRLRDNKSLIEACEASESLCVVYPVDNCFFKLSSAQRHFIFECLKELAVSLKNFGSNLFIFEGNPEDLINRTEQLTQVFCSKVYNSKDQNKIDSIKKACSNKGVQFFETENTCLYKIADLPFDLEQMPKVFTAFRKKIESENLKINCFESPKSFPKPFNIAAVQFEDYKGWQLGGVQSKDFKGGESEGQNRLKHYLWDSDAAQTYKETRNGMILLDDSTKFSPWLAVGALSARDIMVQLKNYEEKRGANDSTYWIYFELLWREYFKLYSLKYESLIFDLKGITQKKIEVSEDQEALFNKWSEGRTGVDFIDANMNELNSTGWMSNRGRQNVASYLSKEIFVDWRWGAQWFADNLVDYDVESNWGNWNYVAGVGVDPRDRKFNIKRQAETYDPAGEYVEKFLNRKCNQQ
jgi:deoxyribodipyrimidine photo-lyase